MSSSIQFSQEIYDLLVIGGGINGAAVANIAAGEGLRVALLEKGDFAGGTSSKSTKLVHGGLRYLEHFEFDLVYEALKERYIQLKSVPYLVKPLTFISPVYRNDRRPLWMMRLGVFLYDLLSGRYRIGEHRALGKEEVGRLIPGIKSEGLVGGVMYYDAQMDDARLCLENVLSAQAKGADVANYTEVYDFIKDAGRVVGVKARNVWNQQEVVIRAKRVVCAVGPWAAGLLQKDDPQATSSIRTTKGIHLVCRQKIADHALLVQTQNDDRFFFIIPWQGHSLIGTTDTDYRGDPDAVGVTEDDVDYLLREARRVLPQHSFRKEDIVTTFVGLRPLVYQSGQQGSPSKVSRQHVFAETPSGLLFILGGKYTTYRRIAIECLNKILSPKKVKSSDEYPLYGSGQMTEGDRDDVQRYGVEPDIIEHLKNKYGTRYRDVLELTRSDISLKKRICSCHLHIEAQIVYAIKTEMARTPEDIIWRRLGIGYVQCEIDKYKEAIRYYLPNR